MTTHCSILAWKIPQTWTEEPGGPQSAEPQRVGRDLARTHTEFFKYANLSTNLAN